MDANRATLRLVDRLAAKEESSHAYASIVSAGVRPARRLRHDATPSRTAHVDRRGGTGWLLDQRATAEHRSPGLSDGIARPAAGHPARRGRQPGRPRTLRWRSG